MTALVLGVIFRAMLSAVRLPVTGSMSAKIGRQLQARIGITVPMSVTHENRSPTRTSKLYARSTATRYTKPP